MSEITSRPQVESVSRVDANAIGAVLAAAAAAALLVRSLTSRGRQVLDELNRTAPMPATNTLLPASELSGAFLDHHCEALETASAQLPVAEARSVATLSALTRTPLLVPANLAVESLPFTKPEELAKVLGNHHHKVFTGALALAVSDASIEAGFDRIETATGLLGETRIIATDPGGRALVTEISADPSKPTSLATELIGVSDASCHSILDKFDEALNRRGVRSQAPSRKFTGGVCETAAAISVIRRRMRPRSLKGVETAPETGRRRAETRPVARIRK